jgi:hypothetical protein
VTSGIYKNSDLPFLRAAVVKKDFVDPIIRGCAAKVQNVFILEGHEFLQSDDPLQRNVQVFISQIKD